MGGGYDTDKKPSSSFVHLSYKSIIDFENLRRTEDTHLFGLIRLFSNFMVSASLGTYVSAKSHLFQDRFGSVVIMAVLVVLLANTPIMSKSQRTAEGYGIYFFGGTFLSTVLWWNFDMDHWVIVRWFMGIAVSGYFYALPYGLVSSYKNFTEPKEAGKIRRTNDTNRFLFFAAGPLANFAGLFVCESVFTAVLGISYFLTPAMRMKIVVAFAAWNFIHGQFNIVKCRLYDRDAIWQMIQLLPETFLALFFVPKSLFVQQEDDY